MYIAGDIHGNLSLIYQWHDSVENQTLVQVGDYALGFGSVEQQSEKLEENLAKKNNKIYVIFGNHDKKSLFRGQGKNLIFLKENSIVNIEGKNVLFLGGGISIDRNSRIPGIDYWEDEVFVLNPSIFELRDIDILVSHIAPIQFTGLLPARQSEFVQGWAKRDETLFEDLDKEQKDITVAWEGLLANNPITNVYHGHFHVVTHFSLNNCKGEICKGRGLAINEIIEIT